jgi:hypothetical protein
MRLEGCTRPFREFSVVPSWERFDESAAGDLW